MKKDSDFKKIVKENIQQAITICGSQVALADKAEITQGAIGKYIREECLPTGVTAKKLSKAVSGKLKPKDFAPHIF